MRFLFGALAVVSLATPALAGPVATGFSSTSLAANNDGYTGAIPLGFSVNFFGHTYSSAFISNNGYITFNAGQSTLAPLGLGLGYLGQPIIAPFIADIDTRGAGSGLTSYGTGAYEGVAAFGATWPLVGYYNQHTNKLDTFQVILANRNDTGAGNFDIFFNYDQIQFESGDLSGGFNGLGGFAASAGFNAGSGNAPGTSYQLPGSTTGGAFLANGTNSLVANSNDGVAGQYEFSFRNGVLAASSPTPVSEPATLALLGVGMTGLALVRRRTA